MSGLMSFKSCTSRATRSMSATSWMRSFLGKTTKKSKKTFAGRVQHLVDVEPILANAKKRPELSMKSATSGLHTIIRLIFTQGSREP